MPSSVAEEPELIELIGEVWLSVSFSAKKLKCVFPEVSTTVDGGKSSSAEMRRSLVDMLIEGHRE